MRKLSRRKASKMSVLPILSDLGDVGVATLANALQANGTVSMEFGILGVLRSSGPPNIMPPIVKRVPINMISQFGASQTKYLPGEHDGPLDLRSDSLLTSNDYVASLVDVDVPFSVKVGGVLGGHECHIPLGEIGEHVVSAFASDRGRRPTAAMPSHLVIVGGHQRPSLPSWAR